MKSKEKKTGAKDCVDPELSLIGEIVKVRLCNGLEASGTLRVCSIDGDTNCIAIPAYPAVPNGTIAAEKVRTGITLAGVSGTYPSEASPLNGDSSTPNLSVYSESEASNFEYWDRHGTKYLLPLEANLIIDAENLPVNPTAPLYRKITITGIPNLLPANIKNGISIYGVTGQANFQYVDPWNLRASTSIGNLAGKMKMNCRNMANTSLWDLPAVDAISNNANSGLTGNGNGVVDWWDTVDDRNFDGSSFPSDNPWGSEDFTCDQDNWVAGGTDAGSVAGPCNESGDDCVYFDRISRLHVSEAQGARSWADAVRRCDQLNALNFGGINSGWRLPTQMELINITINGLSHLQSPFFVPDMYQYLQTATTESGAARRRNGAWAHRVRPLNLYNLSNAKLKSDLVDLVCIRWEPLP